MTGAFEATVPRPRPAFSHASEAELARIFDFYDVRWEYEPDTFPIGWSLEGEVLESFAPDFYLPEMDLYVELTTLKQSLVRKKNRKLRRLRELYPDVRIKLFYARDFRMLLLKFGRLALADELSGTTGQATPPRIAATPDVPRTADGVPAAVVLTGTSADLDRAQAEAAADAEFDADEAAAAAELVPQTPHVTAPSRGRRRGRRRRAAARAAALAAANSSAQTVTVIGPANVPPAGTYPA